MSFLCQGLLEKGFIAKKMSLNAKRVFHFLFLNKKKSRNPLRTNLKRIYWPIKRFQQKRYAAS